jgi:hypothetical protein
VAKRAVAEAPTQGERKAEYLAALESKVDQVRLPRPSLRRSPLACGASHASLLARFVSHVTPDSAIGLSNSHICTQPASLYQRPRRLPSPQG